MDLQLQKKLLEKTKEIEEKTLKHAQDEQELKLKEREMQIDQMKRLIEEMKRKSEQGSMQMRGEAQELVLEDILRTSFRYDIISEIGKDIRGADAVQEIRNNLGQARGTIIYESKGTHSFSEGWIEKLKTDMRSIHADIAIIVTQAMPKDMEHFGQKNGIWICKFQDAVSLAQMLRESLIKVHQAMKSQDNKGDKMQMVY